MINQLMCKKHNFLCFFTSDVQKSLFFIRFLVFGRGQPGDALPIAGLDADSDEDPGAEKKRGSQAGGRRYVRAALRHYDVLAKVDLLI